MSTILAIDPGPFESAWVIIDADTCKPLAFSKEANENVGPLIGAHVLMPPRTHVVIEWIESYGMPVGAEVFETCRWVGRFQEAAECACEGSLPELVTRRTVRLHHCHSSKAKDTNVAHALVDRFAPGAPNYGKGTKAEPGWFHGFKRDVWAAYALAVYVADRETGRA